MHTIKQFPEKRRVEIIFDRFEDHDGDHFLQALQRAVVNAKGAGDCFDLLSDFSQSMVMPQDIANSSKDLAAWLLANGLRKSANILQSATQRMQLSRVTDRNETFAYFATHEEALAWLEQGLA